MLFYRFIILSLSFLLISCGIFVEEGSDQDIGVNDPDNVPSRPWDGKTLNEPKYDNKSRTYYITDATHFAWIMKRNNDNSSQDYDNDTIIFVNNVDMDNRTIQGIRVFRGVLDGNDKTIYNIQIGRSASTKVGLVGEIFDNGTIKDITIRNGKITGSSQVGGIAGRSKNSKITNVKNINVTVKGYVGSIGGIIGFAGETILDRATNSGTVEGGEWVGGIVGDAKDSTITKTANVGKLSGEESIGGIVGYNRSSSISLSHNNGRIWKGIFLGGIIGTSSSGSIDNSSNTKSIEGTSSIGGLVGYATEDVNISHSYNYGGLFPSSALNKGGIIGQEKEIKGDYIDNRYLLEKDLDSVGKPASENAGIRINEADFKKEGNFENWDFNSIWKMQDKYPSLRWILDMDEKKSL